MDRRQFLAAGIVTLASSVRVAARARRPRVMIFGMSVIQDPAIGDTKIWLPGADVPGDIEDGVGNVHRTFLVGPLGVIRKLCGTPVPTKGAGLGSGHVDLEPFDTSETALMGCLPKGTLKVGNGNASFHESLPAYVPHLLNVAKACEPSKSFKIKDLEKVGQAVTIDLGSGVLSPAVDRSKNKGTHGIRWQFRYDRDPAKPPKPVGDVYHLTDLLEFESDETSIEISFGGKEHALGEDEQLWVINVPLWSKPDVSPETIEHAHSWRDLVSPPLAGAFDAQAIDKYKRDGSTGAMLKHPCSTERVRMFYFPPDTDPCFAVML